MLITQSLVFLTLVLSITTGESFSTESLEVNQTTVTPSESTIRSDSPPGGTKRPYTPLQSNVTMEKFVDKYFNEGYYNKHVRPSVNEGLPVVVNVDMYIASVSSINEMNMDFTVTMFFRQRWIDSRLAFTEYDHHIPLNYDMYDKLWIPDTNFKNMKEGYFRDITVPNRLLYLYPDGQVYYSQGLMLVLECYMDLIKFPMDRQSCDIKLGSYGYAENDVIVQWRNISEPVQIADSFELPEFYFSHLEYGDCTKVYITGTFSCRYTRLVFDRKFNYYLIQVYIPAILVVILSWVSFWIDIDAVPARVSLGLLTVLTMTTQVSGMTSRQPRVSYVKALDVWMTACLLFVFGSLVEYCIVNVLYRREKNEEEDKKQRMSVLMGMANSAFVVAQNANQKGKDPQAEKKKPANGSLQAVANKKVPSYIPQFRAKGPHCPFWDYKHYKGRRALYVDVMARYLFPFIFVFFCIIYWIIYKFIV